MGSPVYTCWHCKQTLEELLSPLPRLAKCPSCKADLHVCRMCEFFDPTVSDSCREPIAERVSDKKKANFCGYFQPGHRGTDNDNTGTSENQGALENLFGLGEGESNMSSSDPDKSQAELNALFGLDKDDQK